ncbi:ras-domain-containing protein [Piedraia hortae CBS 480.64]|uniref:Ras-domain-containing protein n=1 Tax=Piedraia hortae CBS 480.64 TaxID=1314780 RepID=A0A6A7C890_9PEZI|nr:ras-domain-containing protein [Piedraia hortae CBS 480.64]
MSNISVTICGQGGCGKSSITLRFVCNQWDQGYDPTIEDRYTVVRTVDGVTYTLNLTDTAGQEEYRELWRLSRVQSDAFLLVYDITQPGSLEALELFNQTVEAQCQAAMDLGHVVPVCLVVGNKSDLESTRRVPIQDGFVWAHARGYGFVEASARTNSNIEQIFTSLVRNLLTCLARRKIKDKALGLPNEGMPTRYLLANVWDPMGIPEEPEQQPFRFQHLPR